MAMQKRKSTGVLQPGGSAQTNEVSRDSGIPQPADNEGFRILVVDAGWIRRAIFQHCVRDHRNLVGVDDMMQTSEQFNVGCIVGTDFSALEPPHSTHMRGSSLRNSQTSWHVCIIGCDLHWKRGIIEVALEAGHC